MAISLYVISAICGNFYQESGVNPAIYESLNIVPLTDNDVYGGYGIGQWTNKPEYGLTRRTQLVQWLQNNNFSVDSGQGQLEYLIHENYWHQNVGNYGSLTSFLNSDSTDLNSLTYQYMRNWEGINSNTIGIRQTWASNFYDYIYNHINDSDITTWAKGNRYLSENERYNNAVLVARFFWNYEPPIDPPNPPIIPPIPPDEFVPTTEQLMCIMKRRKRFKKFDN